MRYWICSIGICFGLVILVTQFIGQKNDEKKFRVWEFGDICISVSRLLKEIANECPNLEVNSEVASTSSFTDVKLHLTVSTKSTKEKGVFTDVKAYGCLVLDEGLVARQPCEIFNISGELGYDDIYSLQEILRSVSPMNRSA